MDGAEAHLKVWPARLPGGTYAHPSTVSPFYMPLRYYGRGSDWVLGFSLWRRDHINRPPVQDVVYLKLGDTMLELLDITDPAPAADRVSSPQENQPYRVGYRMMALEVDDMDKARSYLQEQGYHFTWGPVEGGDYIRSEIRDPDGLPIELRYWQSSPSLRGGAFPPTRD